MSDEYDDPFKRLMLGFRSSAMAEFDAIDNRFTGLDGGMDGLEIRMGNLESSMAELKHEYRTRTLTMETAILNSIRDLTRSIDSRFERTDRRLDALEARDDQA